MPAAVRESPRPAGPDLPVLIGVLVCFGLSGFAALLYQVAWLRQFSLVFGTSELAVATVLAAYMAGLALGAAVAGRFAARIRRPVWVYGLLEAGIALSALAVPWLLSLAGALYGALLGGRPDPPDAATLGQPLFYLAVAFAVLAIPTSLMGATLPLLTRHAVTNDRELGPRVALLYATNTAGAVLGALTAGFLLLPALELQRTVLTGFWLLPALGFGGSVNLAVCSNALLAVVALFCATPPRRRAADVASAGLLAAGLLYHPARPEAVLAGTEILSQRFAELRETFYAVGRSATVLVVDNLEAYRLFTNGLAEASIAGRGSPPARDAQAWLTALAIVARPESESLLVVGLGGGASLG
jgi:MFS family permease